MHSADGGPKTGPTKYDYLRRLARFFNRMQAEPSLAAALYGEEEDVGVGAEAGSPVEGEARVRCVSLSLVVGRWLVSWLFVC